ncbi:MAG: DUF4169 family protein [Phyllobacterium sp.]
MNNVVNLRQFRKRKAREEREQSAAENRVLHGRTKADKEFQRRTQEKAAQFLDQSRLERKPESEK